ncbi:hypothetical protein [Streptomyces spinosisporus]|uniref:DUF3761 domain-containing protein n=1 Tax=Streptomyces spinosisporus TaxID=2927582 RepID=A0ABS9XJ19_9ACTN|nr:hypothetical protein [Streptomyces spinosisporus]MCI3240897.1 hypothetical protein [Streptomyces spinosisporus]
MNTTHHSARNRRPRIRFRAAGLLVAGVIVAASGCSSGQPVETKAKPATTVTATVTTTPEPGPTVTETVTAKPKPRPTVTVTHTTTARVAAAGSGSSGSGGSSQDDTGTCSIRSNAGNCYSAGQFCRNSDHGSVTTNASGAAIKCTYSSNAWRWTYA